MKANKKLFIFPLIGFSTFIPTSVVSCSSNSSTNDSYSYLNDLLNLISNQQVNIKFVLKNKAQKDVTIDIFEKDLSTNSNENIEKIYLELDKSKINIDNENEKNKRIKEIEDKINAVSIEYSHYYFPVLNKDEKSLIFFKLKMNNVEKECSINFQKLADINNFKIKKLTDLELKDQIRNKILSIRNIVPNLSNIIEQFLLNNLNEQNNENKILISDVLKTNINRFIVKSCKYFNNNETNNNYYSLINNVDFNKDKNESKYKLNIKLWTSMIDENNVDNTSLIQIPFNYNVIQVVNDFINNIKMKIKEEKINEKKNTLISNIKDIDSWFDNVPSSFEKIHVKLVSFGVDANDPTILNVVYEISCGQYKKNYTKSETGFKSPVSKLKGR